VKMILAEEVAARPTRRVLVFMFTKVTAACQLIFGREKGKRGKQGERGWIFKSAFRPEFGSKVLAHPAQRDLRCC
jgi:hypothetical protein